MGTKAQAGIGGGFDQFGQFLPFFRVPFAQHVVGLLAGVEILADADAQAGVVVAAGQLVDVFEAVVAGIAPLSPQAEPPEIEVKVVHYDEQVFLRDLLGLQPIAHGLPTEVHERIRLEHHHLLSPVLQPRHVAEAVGLPFGVQLFYDPEADVVAGVFVLGTGIPQSND